MWHSKIVQSAKIRREWLQNEDSKPTPTYRRCLMTLVHIVRAIEMDFNGEFVAIVWPSVSQKRVNLTVCVTLTLFCKLKLSTRTIFGQIMDCSTGTCMWHRWCDCQTNSHHTSSYIGRNFYCCQQWFFITLNANEEPMWYVCILHRSAAAHSNAESTTCNQSIFRQQSHTTFGFSSFCSPLS